METYAVLREAFLSGEAGSVEQISAFKKSVTGRVIPKSERERLEIFEHMLSLSLIHISINQSIRQSRRRQAARMGWIGLS